MSSLVEQAVNRWKIQSFRNTDVPYGAAVRSLSTDDPMVEAKKISGSEWVVCGKGSGHGGTILTV